MEAAKRRARTTKKPKATPEVVASDFQRMEVNLDSLGLRLATDAIVSYFAC